MKIDRATHTVIHEWMHAFGDQAHLDDTPEWYALSGWRYDPQGEPGPGEERYIEKRSGWKQGPSPWVYRKGSWAPRSYSLKSPSELFADCGLWYLVGWDFGEAGQPYKEYIQNAMRQFGL